MNTYCQSFREAMSGELVALNEWSQECPRQRTFVFVLVSLWLLCHILPFFLPAQPPEQQTAWEWMKEVAGAYKSILWDNRQTLAMIESISGVPVVSGPQVPLTAIGSIIAAWFLGVKRQQQQVPKQITSASPGPPALEAPAAAATTNQVWVLAKPKEAVSAAKAMLTPLRPQRQLTLADLSPTPVRRVLRLD